MAILEDLPEITTFTDTDLFYLRNPSSNVDYKITGDNLVDTITGGSAFVDVSTDKLITEGTGTTYFCNNTTNRIEITMPDPSTNKNNVYTITKIDSGVGVTLIFPNASEKLGGVDVLYLFEQDDTVKLRSNGVNWIIENTFHPYFKSGFINRSDWTNVHLGFLQISYGSLTGAFKLGEHVSGGTSLTDAIIIDDTASVLTVVSVSGGTNNFTSAETITGATSGATATVSSNTKNVDSNILHNWNTGLLDIDLIGYIFSSASFNGAWNMPISWQSSSTSNDFGNGLIGIDSNSFKNQTGLSGLLLMADTGSSVFLTTQNYYYNQIVRLK